jgi:hypothetical protein
MGCCGSAPKQPDYAASERAGVLAKANALPTQKLIENAATTGGKVTVGGKTYDFTGLGEAEIQAKYADAMAQAALDIQREQGPAYIEQRNKELQLADPEGYAMRKKQFDSIMAQLGQTPGTQDSIALQDSVLKDLEKGGQLDPEVERQARQQILGQQVKRGNMRGQAAASQEAQGMTALSDSVKADRRSRAMQFLQSGATPEDITFRQEFAGHGQPWDVHQLRDSNGSVRATQQRWGCPGKPHGAGSGDGLHRRKRRQVGKRQRRSPAGLAE